MPPAEQLGQGWEHRHGWVYFNFLWEEGWSAHRHAHCDKDICKEGGESFSGSAIRRAQGQCGFLAREGLACRRRSSWGSQSSSTGWQPLLEVILKVQILPVCALTGSAGLQPLLAAGVCEGIIHRDKYLFLSDWWTKADPARERHPSSHTLMPGGGCWGFQQSLFWCLFAFCAHLFSILHLIPM